MYARGSKDGSSESVEADTDRGLFARFVEGAITFVICCLLIRWGISLLISVRIPLLIVAGSAGGITVLWRLYRWRKHRDEY